MLTCEGMDFYLTCKKVQKIERLNRTFEWLYVKIFNCTRKNEKKLSLKYCTTNEKIKHFLL